MQKYPLRASIILLIILTTTKIIRIIIGILSMFFLERALVDTYDDVANRLNTNSIEIIISGIRILEKDSLVVEYAIKPPPKYKYNMFSEVMNASMLNSINLLYFIL